MVQSELQFLVDSLAQRLDAPVLLEDTRAGIVAYSPGQEDTDSVRMASILRREVPVEVERYVRQLGVFEATEPVHVHLPPTIAPGHRGRLAVPVRHGEQNLGALWIVDDGAALDEEQTHIVRSAARRAGQLLYEEHLNGRLGAQMLAQLLSPVEELRLEAAAELRGHRFTRPFCVAVLRPLGRDLDDDHRLSADVAEAPIAGRAGERLVLTMQHHVVLLDALAAEDDHLAPLRSLLDRLDARTGGHVQRWVCGVGDPRTSLSDARTAYQEARRASELAAANRPAGRLQRWSDMGPFRVLLTVPRHAGADPIDPRLNELMDAQHRSLVVTAERFLDLAGDAAATAKSLNVHRGTVYYRLGRVEALTGMSFDDGLDRLALHMALKLHATWSPSGDAWDGPEYQGSR